MCPKLRAKKWTGGNTYDASKRDAAREKSATSNTYNILDVLKEKLREQAEGFKDEATLIVEMEPAEPHEYIIRHASRG